MGGVDRVMSSCSTPSNQDEVRAGACFGDFINLDINLELNNEQLIQLLAGVLSAGPELPLSAPAADPGTNAEGQKLPDLPDLLSGLDPEEPQSQGPGSTEPAPAVTCSLLGMCRVPASSLTGAQQSDVGRLLLGPAVTS